MRRAVAIGLAGSAVLVVLGLPFLGVTWGFPDDRVLPDVRVGASGRRRCATGFADNSETAVTVVVPDAAGLTPADFERLRRRGCRAVADVSAVSAPTGTFVAGRKVGPPVGRRRVADGSAFLTVGSSAPLFSRRPTTNWIGCTSSPRRAVAPSSSPASPRSTATASTPSPRACRWCSASSPSITFVLLFLLTGSVVLPVKALVLNALSLTAAFGALVWIFQDGHLGAFGTTPTGTLVANMPVLLFCIAFGLSMDYEVFLISRIREFWLRSGRAGADNDESVALGLAHTGRVVTAAALVMSISFAALIAAQVSFMRMFGVGLTLAVRGGCHAGPDGAGACVHAHPRAMELVGTRPLPAPRARHRSRLAPAGQVGISASAIRTGAATNEDVWPAALEMAGAPTNPGQDRELPNA